MKTAAMLKISLGIVVGTVAALATVGGTHALWSTTAPFGGGVVQAADFDLVYFDGSGTRHKLDGPGAPVLTKIKASGPLLPGHSVVHEIGLKHEGNASADFNLLVGLTSAKIVDKNLIKHMSLSVAFSKESGCAAADYVRINIDTGTPSSAVPMARLTPGESARLCLRTVLAENAPISVSSINGAVGLEITANQEP